LNYLTTHHLIVRIIVNYCHAYRWSTKAHDSDFDEETYIDHLREIGNGACPIMYDNLDADALRIEHSFKPVMNYLCVYSNCGHTYSPAARRNPGLGRCPMCRLPGPIQPLRYRHNNHISGRATHVLSCGHAVDEECARRTMNVKVLDESNFPISNDAWTYEGKNVCPFCKETVTGYERLHINTKESSK
jgi:hypothetical protein